MVGRVLLAALLAGIAAGLLLGILTEARLVPLILQAEAFESASVGHAHAGEPAGTDAHSHDQSAWAPQDGWERTTFTLLTSMLAGAGFSALLTGASFLLGLPITKRTGLMWGLCGFAAVSLAPAAGLPPELPGMPAAALGIRQAWWVLAITCTAAALWLFAVRREWWAAVVALALVLAPHVIGAPVAPAHETKVGAILIQTFVANSLAINCVFWVALGVMLGHVLEKFEEEAKA
jgi:cobalt transporter subunit CbtA